MNYTRAIRKAVKIQKLQTRRMNSILAENGNTNSTCNRQENTNSCLDTNNLEGLTPKQREIAQKLIASGNYKGFSFFEEDYNHLRRNLLSNIVVINGMEVVVVQHSIAFHFSFIEN